MSIGHEHVHLLSLHVHIQTADVPRFLKVKQSGVKGDVGHDDGLRGKNPLQTRKSQIPEEPFSGLPNDPLQRFPQGT
jgi:hypothetical protein